MRLVSIHRSLKKPAFSKEGRLKLAEKAKKKLEAGWASLIKALYHAPYRKPFIQGGGGGFGNGPRIPEGYDPGETAAQRKAKDKGAPTQ